MSTGAGDDKGRGRIPVERDAEDEWRANWDAAEYASPWEHEEAELRASADRIRGDEAPVISLDEEKPAQGGRSERAGATEGAERAARGVRALPPSAGWTGAGGDELRSGPDLGAAPRARRGTMHSARRGSGYSSAALTVVILGVLGVAGYLALGGVRSDGSEVEAGVRNAAGLQAAVPVTREPRGLSRAPLSPEDSALALIRPSGLGERIRAAFEKARGDVAAEVGGMRTDHGLPARPPEIWLEGAYLAGAGQYPEVVEYWRAVQGFMNQLRDTLPELVRDAYRERLAEAEISPRTAGILLEEALIAFAREERARAQVFAPVEGIVAAALDLHAFLVSREDEIEYDPFTASGLTRDPVLEAVPTSEELGEEIWEYLTRLYDGLDVVGALEGPDSETLVAHVTDGLQAQIEG